MKENDPASEREEERRKRRKVGQWAQRRGKEENHAKIARTIGKRIPEGENRRRRDGKRSCRNQTTTEKRVKRTAEVHKGAAANDKARHREQTWKGREKQGETHKEGNGTRKDGGGQTQVAKSPDGEGHKKGQREQNGGGAEITSVENGKQGEGKTNGKRATEGQT